MAVYQATREGVDELLAARLARARAAGDARRSSASPANRVQGFLAAGHVCTVMGFEEYEPIAARYRVPIVVTGFEPLDILQGVCMCVRAARGGPGRGREPVRAARCGARATAPAQRADARGVPRSCAAQVARHRRDPRERPRPRRRVSRLRRRDALRRGRRRATRSRASASAAWSCRGEKKPPECPAFGTRCTPEHPLGATMVSSEGACAAYYRYRGVAARARRSRRRWPTTSFALACPVPDRPATRPCSSRTAAAGAPCERLIDTIFRPAFDDPRARPPPRRRRASSVPGRSPSPPTPTSSARSSSPAATSARSPSTARSTTWPCAARGPLYLSAGFILEEGLPMATLGRVVASMRDAAAAAGVAHRHRRHQGRRPRQGRRRLHQHRRHRRRSSAARPIEPRRVAPGRRGDPAQRRRRPARHRHHGGARGARRSRRAIESDCAPLAEPVLALLDGGRRGPLPARPDARRPRQRAGRDRRDRRRSASRSTKRAIAGARGRRAAPARSSASIRSTSPTRAASSPSSRRTRPSARSPSCAARGLGARRSRSARVSAGPPAGCRAAGHRRHAGRRHAERRAAAAHLLIRCRLGGARWIGWRAGSPFHLRLPEPVDRGDRPGAVEHHCVIEVVNRNQGQQRKVAPLPATARAGGPPGAAGSRDDRGAGRREGRADGAGPARPPQRLLRPHAGHPGWQAGAAGAAGPHRAVFDRAVRALSAFGEGAGGRRWPRSTSRACRPARSRRSPRSSVVTASRPRSTPGWTKAWPSSPARRLDDARPDLILGRPLRARARSRRDPQPGAAQPALWTTLRVAHKGPPPSP